MYVAPFLALRILKDAKHIELTLYHTSLLFTTLGNKPFENIVGKGENAGINQHFLLFPQCFLPNR